jgi:hypothetical protein
MMSSRGTTFIGRGWTIAGACGIFCACIAAGVAEPRTGGLDELVVYDSGTHSRGLAGVQLFESPDGTLVDVAPAIHVHRNYYNGDREYQGPILPGGPTVVVAQHPRTGQRLYVDVNLPAGAPVICYDEDSITYVYRDGRVCLRFGIDDGCECVTVVNRSGRGAARVARERSQATRERCRIAVERSGVAASVKKAGASVKHTLVGAVGITSRAATGVVDRVRTVRDGLPVVRQVQDAGQQADERSEMQTVRRVGDERAENADRGLITTNR